MGSKGNDTRKKTVYNRMGMLCIILTVFILLIAMMLRSSGLSAGIEQYRERAVTLKRLIDEEKQRTQEIEELRKYMETDAYAEQIARERIGLVKDNEIVFEEAD